MHIVLDGLSRSGTTLLSSILNSTDQSVCYRGIFHEGLCNSICRKWATSHACKGILNKEKRIFIVNNKTDIRYVSSRYLSSFFKIDIPVIPLEDFFNEAFKIVKSENQTQYINFDEWINIINKQKHLINSEESFYQNIDIMLNKIRERSNAKYAFWRWNNGLYMYKKWIQRESHLWLMLIRDPIAAAISRNKIWGTSFENSLKISSSYGKYFDEIKNESNFEYIYFEDLINQTEKCFEKITKFTGLQNLRSDDLIGQDGEPYRKETSDLGSQRKKGVLCNFVDPRTARETKNSKEYQKQFKYFSKLKKYNVYERYF